VVITNCNSLGFEKSQGFTVKPFQPATLHSECMKPLASCQGTKGNTVFRIGAVPLSFVTLGAV
jgi:hypothetical protein